MITSVNFEFLRAKRSGVVEFVAFAEQHAWPDPSSALVKLRNFVELMVATIYAELRLVAPRNAHLNDLLNELPGAAHGQNSPRPEHPGHPWHEPRRLHHGRWRQRRRKRR